jgi:signal transduction histidine kinase
MENGLLKDLDKNIPIGISICDKNGNFLRVHEYFNDIFDNDDIKTINDVKKIKDLIDSDKEFISFYIKEKIRNRYFRLDKSYVDDYIILILSDITFLTSKYNNYKLAEYTVENNILPILWIRDDGQIVYHNKSTKKYIGNEDINGTKIYRIASDIKKSDWVDLWDGLHKNSTKEFVHRFYNKQEDKIHVFRIVANLAKYYDWEYCYMVISDITELVDSNIKLQREKEKATESERLKDVFLLNMSHEIRTPMNAIVGFSEIIHENIDPSLKEYTKIITENVDYLLSLIDNIITISKIDSNQIKVKYSTFDVLEMLEDIQFSYNIKLKKLKKDLYIIIDNNHGVIINSDKYIIEESIHRLIDNAIKFTEKGYINIGYNIVADYIVFYVKDTGEGIENKYHEIIFDRFRQIDKHVMGSGLGLAIFASYINILGGKYDIDSTLNDGTIISFSLNIDGNEKLKKVDVKSIDYLNLNNKRILVVEDLVVNQIMLYDMLTPYEVNIVKAMNGRECIEKFLEIKNIDLILMDLDMPDIDGYEATQIIREKDKAIPIIIQTAYAHKENREKAKRLGVNDFITKPINKDNLIKVILKNLK